MNTRITNLKASMIIVLIVGIAASAAVGTQIQRSIVIEPYPQEKLENLERNISTISLPAQQLFNAMETLQKAQEEYQQDSTPASKARFNRAKALALDRVSRFVDTARATKTPLMIGFQDLADYLDVNASAMNQHVEQNPEVKRTVAYMQRQAKAIREFADDFEGMVTQFEQCGNDLAKRASGWAASSRVIGMMQDVYGPGGTETVYNTMASVVDSMGRLKSIFSTEDLLAESFDSEKKEADLKRAKQNYRRAIEEYYRK